MNYKYFPERLLDELQSSVRNKIQSHEDFQLTEKEALVTKEFLQDTVIHIENICDCEGSLFAAIDFYMQIGAKIPNSTVKYVENSSGSNGMKQRLKAYSKVVKRPVITIHRQGGLVDRGTMGVFTSVNIDRGTRRKVIYADSFHNLMRNIKAWVNDDSTCFIRTDQEYDLVVDGEHIASIKKDKTVEVVCSRAVDAFIADQFGEPMSVKLSIRSEVLKGKCGFYWLCDDSYSGSSSLFLPSQTSLRVDIIRDEVKVIVSQALQAVRCGSNVTSDIYVTVDINGVGLGKFDKKYCSLKFVENNADVILGAVGVDERPNIDFYVTDKSSINKGFLRKIFKFLKF